MLIFWTAFCIGYAHQWASPAVGFSPVKWLDYLTRPRFEQPWGRGRLGDFGALIYELNMLINLVPPLAGIILARRHRFGILSLVLVVSGFLLVLFIAFAGATRSVLASYLVTFVIGFAFASSKGRKKELLVVSGAAAAMMMFGTVAMLHIRSQGLKNSSPEKRPTRSPRPTPCMWTTTCATSRSSRPYFRRGCPTSASRCRISH